MTPIQMDDLLAQIRALQAQATAAPQGEKVSASAGAEFSSLLSQAVEKVNDMQMRARQLSEAFEQGDPKVDLVEVMVGLQKAGLAFQTMVEVRNHVVRAYQDIMNMPI